LNYTDQIVPICENRLTGIQVCEIKGKRVAGCYLPGGKIGHSESIDDDAHWVLEERTGLTNVFLQQYYTFNKVKYRRALSQNKDPGF
jgi:ADP-ribose pyrophosphatase YjhB (NUDIX family)